MIFKSNDCVGQKDIEVLENGG